MSDDRKNVKVSAGVKQILADRKKFKEVVKTESEYIAYLYLMAEWAYKNMKIEQYREIREKAKVIDRKLTL